jgi:hypothetical protein
MHTAEQLGPGPSHLDVEIAIAKLKKYKSPGTDQIPVELIQAIHKLLILFGIGLSCYQLHTKFYQISFSQG